MIIRNTGVRHGRRALAAPPVRSLLRPISMLSKTAVSSTKTATAVADDPNAKDAELRNALSAAMAFKRRREEAEALKAEVAKIPANFRQFVNIQKHTKGLGSVVQPRYEVGALLRDPPADASLEMLLAAQAHMGHNTSLWNPANSRYIYGVRDGIHIISLESTAAHLRRAARVVEEVAYGGGLVLFVGTRKGQKQAVVRAAEMADGCHLFQQWVPGTITNRDMILTGEAVRIVDMLDRDVEGCEEMRGELRPLTPDLVVCMNPLENYVLLDECGQANIPTIGVIDTDADPTWVTYQIPANDDSLRTIELLAAVLGRAGERGQKRRLADAGRGICTWEEQAGPRNFKQKKMAEIQKALELKEMEKETEARNSSEGGEGMSGQDGGGEALWGDLRDQLSQQAIRETAPPV